MDWSTIAPDESLGLAYLVLGGLGGLALLAYLWWTACPEQGEGEEPA